VEAVDFSYFPHIKEEVCVLQNGFRTATIALVILLLAVPAYAIDTSGKVGIGARGGGFLSGGEWDIGPMGGADLKFGVTKYWSLGLTGMYGATPGGMLVYENGTQKIVESDDVSHDIRIRHFIGEAAAWYNITPDAEKANFYLVGGAGIASWHTRNDYDQRVYVDDLVGGTFEYKDNQLALMIGAGAEYFLVEEFSIGGGLRYHFLTSVGSQFKDDRDVGDNLDNPAGILELAATITAYLGACKDSDKDDVCDEDDKCPETPKGCVVDESGCPVDSDGDGVCDGLDQCPNTPRGCKVDMNGCLADTDGDGVCDGVDKCPDTPAGVEVDNGGCPLDEDDDGVPDYQDKCLGTPTCCKVDNTGCEVDSDGDGVCDGCDECPGTPAGLAVDEKGCPVQYKIEKEMVLDGIRFRVNSAELNQSSKEVVDKMVAALKALPHVKVEVQGHTDISGTREWNMELSQMRAQSVVDYMIESGIDPSRLIAKGYGPDQPKFDNKTEDGRRNNRRVEVVRLN
jgi:outer membrane protein OmpA-like peptidoglycan-associated protein